MYVSATCCRPCRCCGCIRPSATTRWTDKVAGLLRTASFHLQARLVSLDLGCVRLSRDPAACLLEPLAGLTALSDLRMSLHSNSDDQLTLHLSQLSALSNLQVRPCASVLYAVRCSSLHLFNYWSHLSPPPCLYATHKRC